MKGEFPCGSNNMNYTKRLYYKDISGLVTLKTVTDLKFGNLLFSGQ